MDDAGDLFAAGLYLSQDTFDRRLVGHIGLDEAETGLSIEPFQAGALECDTVIVIEIIDADHLIAARQQAPRRHGSR